MPEKKVKVSENALKVRNLDIEIKDKTETNYTAILWAGGKGTRLADIRGETPKPLFKVGGKELIRYSIDLMNPSIVRELIFVVDYKAEEIKTWARSADLPYTIKFSQKHDAAIPEATKVAFQQVEGDKSVITSTDEIRINFDLLKAVQFHESHNSLATVVITPTSKLYKHGVVEIDEDKNVLSLRSGKEYASKPEVVGLINTSFFLMRKSAADYFDLQNTEGSYGITEPLIKAKQLKAYIAPDLIYANVNTKEEFLDFESKLKKITRDH